jgi:hypothetical protein
MSPLRKLLLAGLGVAALHGVQACASDTELNPQPLPPETGDPQRTPPADGKNGSTATGTSGGSSGTPASASDASAEAGDASDAGAD